VHAFKVQSWCPCRSCKVDVAMYVVNQVVLRTRSHKGEAVDQIHRREKLRCQIRATETEPRCVRVTKIILLRPYNPFTLEEKNMYRVVCLHSIVCWTLIFRLKRRSRRRKMDVINSCVHRNELTVKQQIAARNYVGSIISFFFF
jgi:hypothetical protein